VNAWVWVFGLLFAGFVIWVFVRGPRDPAPYQIGIIALIGAVLPGLLTFFVVHRIISSRLSVETPGGVTIAVEGGSSVVVFVAALVWWAYYLRTGRAPSIAPKAGRPDDGNLPEGFLNKLLDRYGESQQKIGVLKEQRQAAVHRAEIAEQHNPSAHAALVAVRQTGDTELLLKFLVQERDRCTVQTRKLELQREIAAVAYLRGELAIAENAVHEVLDALPNDIGALSTKGHICKMRGLLREGKDVYETIRDLSQDRQDHNGLAIAHMGLGDILLVEGDHQGAERMYTKSLKIEQSLGHRKGVSAAYGSLGALFRVRAAVSRQPVDLDKATKFFRKAMKIDKEDSNLEFLSRDYTNLGLIEELRGDLQEAERLHHKALVIAQGHGDKVDLAAAYNNLGLVYVGCNELDKAEDMIREALKLNEQVGRPLGIARQYGNLGLIYAKRGRTDKAQEHWEDAREKFGALGAVNEVRILTDALHRLAGCVPGREQPDEQKTRNNGRARGV